MKKKVRKPFDEQETIINIDPPQLSTKASVYSTIPATINMMWQLRKKHPDLVEVVADDKWGSEFKIPYAWISIKPKKELTSEQKQNLVKRLSQKNSQAKPEKK